jgi:hypothetical protein
MSSLSEAISSLHRSPSLPYVPDFTVRATTDLQYIRISRTHYLVALRATLLERGRRAQLDGSQQGTQAAHSDDDDPFTKEWNRAQSVPVGTTPDTTPLGTSPIDVRSMRDDSSVRDVVFSQPSADGNTSDPGTGTGDAGMSATDPLTTSFGVNAAVSNEGIVCRL